MFINSFTFYEPLTNLQSGPPDLRPRSSTPAAREELKFKLRILYSHFRGFSKCYILRQNNTNSN